VLDKKNDKVVATYRLFAGEATANFYSASEFDLSHLSRLQGPFLEMGRACIHKDYRRSVILNLLWRGISAYLKLSECRYLMGCGSIKTEDVKMSALLTDYLLKNGHAVTEISCDPHEKYRLKGFSTELNQLRMSHNVDHSLAEKLIPALLKSYLNAGARLLPVPAWDTEFKCIDYLVLLDKEKIDATYGKKYAVVAGEKNE
jgi:putative hemolysin